jgi:hypothetical protein
MRTAEEGWRSQCGVAMVRIMGLEVIFQRLFSVKVTLFPNCQMGKLRATWVGSESYLTGAQEALLLEGTEDPWVRVVHKL